MAVIITIDFGFRKWKSVFYDDRLTSAIIDRLVHHCHLIVFTGRSYTLEYYTSGVQTAIPRFWVYCC